MNEPNPTTDPFGARVAALLQAAVAGLDPADTAERMAWCRAHNAHGVRMHRDESDDVLEFRWGGRTLAMVRAADLADPDAELAAEFVAEDVPDTVPDDL